MKTSFRQYRHATDYEAVEAFLIRTYSTTGPHINWLQLLQTGRSPRYR